MKKKLYGLVLCGGQSSRMGFDKSLIDYHGQPQRYHVYHMLEQLCEKVFICCNKAQAGSVIKQYETLTDLPLYSNIGPMAALMTAFTTYPHHDFLVAGCDYPFITTNDLKQFIESVEKEKIAAGFYNKEHSLYEPLLAWYSQKSENEFRCMFKDKQYSLQQFLRENNAGKYEPDRPESIVSVDTLADYKKVKEVLNRQDI